MAKIYANEIIKAAADCVGIGDTYDSAVPGEVGAYLFQVLQGLMRAMNTDDSFPVDIKEVKCTPSMETYFAKSWANPDSAHVSTGFDIMAPALKVVYQTSEYDRVPVEDLYGIPVNIWKVGWVDTYEADPVSKEEQASWKCRMYLPLGETSFIFKVPLTVPQAITDEMRVPANLIEYIKLFCAERAGLHYGVDMAYISESVKKEYQRIAKKQSASYGDFTMNTKRGRNDWWSQQFGGR